MEYKICLKCGIEKDLSEFYFHKQSNNYYSCCKKCKNGIRVINIKKQYHNDEKFKIASLTRTRLSKINKEEHSLKYLGCGIEFFHRWLNFTKDYYVSKNYIGKLHIDHFIPQSSFNLTDNNELQKAEHWTNKRYLSADDNLRKHAKIPSIEEEMKHILIGIIFKVLENGI